METILNLIGGELVRPAKGRYLDNYAPSTGKVYSIVPNSSAEDIQDAVSAARKAFPAWSEMPVAGRAEWMFKLAAALDDNADKFARAESFDQGKPLLMARTVDVKRASAFIRFFAHAIMSYKSTSFMDIPNVVNYVNRLPIGPCGLITPWNYPLPILAWKIAPCIATGNTAICKPSELTPMTAYLFSELLLEIGFPRGVINIVHGEGAIAGQKLVEHSEVPVISFTGGTKTGATIASAAAPFFKKVSLELGGKNPNIIFADCDFEQALGTSLRSSFLNQGEICLSGSRIYIEKSIYRRFVDRFVEETDRLKVGDPKDEKVFMGALVSRNHLEKVLSYVELAKVSGGRVLSQTSLTGLRDELKEGFYMRPTVIADIPPGCRFEQEEVFGPAVSVTPFETEEDLLAMANGVRHGLSASLWTSNLSRAHRLSRQLQAGVVWVNAWMERSMQAPFGGMKSSGLGREGGEYSLDFFTEIQNIHMRT